MKGARQIKVEIGPIYDRLSDLVHELRTTLLDQATNKDLTALAHRRRCMKMRNKIAAFYGQQ